MSNVRCNIHKYSGGWRKILTRDGVCGDDIGPNSNYWETDKTKKKNKKKIFVQCDRSIHEKYTKLINNIQDDDYKDCTYSLSEIWKKAVEKLGTGEDKLYEDFEFELKEFMKKIDEDNNGENYENNYNNLKTLAAYEMCRIENERYRNERSGYTQFMDSSFMNTMAYIVVGIIFIRLFAGLFKQVNIPEQSFWRKVFQEYKGNSVNISENVYNRLFIFFIFILAFPLYIFIFGIINSKFKDEEKKYKMYVTIAIAIAVIFGILLIAIVIKYFEQEIKSWQIAVAIGGIGLLTYLGHFILSLTAQDEFKNFENFENSNKNKKIHNWIWIILMIIPLLIAIFAIIKGYTKWWDSLYLFLSLFCFSLSMLIAPYIKTSNFEMYREFVPLLGSTQNIGWRLVIFYGFFALLCAINMIKKDIVYYPTVIFLFTMIMILNLYFMISNPLGYLLLLVIFRMSGELKKYIGDNKFIIALYALLGKRISDDWSIPFIELVAIIAILTKTQDGDSKTKAFLKYFNPPVRTNPSSGI